MAIQAIPNYIRDLTRLPRRDYVPPRNDDSGSHATKPSVARNDGLYRPLSLKLTLIHLRRNDHKPQLFPTIPFNKYIIIIYN
ncbi:hypothetical protein [Rickettsia endosymbiont of Aspidapion aeneum]|uniref:hypothetical protein n=1 Tax=Rickettsia endosymbiont of Aspidapion aeneum TaxID=3066247 RepID=UPI00313ABF13